MADIPTFEKAVGADRTFGVDWDQKNLPAGVTITVSTWTVDSGITKMGASLRPGNRVAVVQLSGGVAHTDYTAKNHITRSDGEADERTITVQVRNL